MVLMNIKDESFEFVSKLGSFISEQRLKSKPLIVICVETKLKEELVRHYFILNSGERRRWF